MRQSPRYFFKYLTERLERHGLKPSNLYLCMVVSTNPGLTNHKTDGTQIGESLRNVATDQHALIVIVYVGDMLVYARDSKDIDTLIFKLQNDDVLLRREGTAEGYLGIKVEHDGNKTILTQPGLTKRIIETLGLCNKYSTEISTPCKNAALPQNVDDKAASGAINYSSVVGMLLYLGHTRPDIAFAVH